MPVAGSRSVEPSFYQLEIGSGRIAGRIHRSECLGPKCSIRGNDVRLLGEEVVQLAPKLGISTKVRSFRLAVGRSPHLVPQLESMRAGLMIDVHGLPSPTRFVN